MDKQKTTKDLLYLARLGLRPLPKPIGLSLPREGWYNRRTYSNGREYLFYRWHDDVTGRVVSKCLGRLDTVKGAL